MHWKRLLILTAAIEVGTGLSLVFTPSIVAELLTGIPLGTREAMLVARIGGAGLMSIGVNCWLERGRQSTPKSLIQGLLVYNVAVPLLVVYAAAVENIHGLALWPAFMLHAMLAIWCVACLRSSDRN